MKPLHQQKNEGKLTWSRNAKSSGPLFAGLPLKEVKFVKKYDRKLLEDAQCIFLRDKDWKTEERSKSAEKSISLLLRCFSNKIISIFVEIFHHNILTKTPHGYIRVTYTSNTRIYGYIRIHTSEMFLLFYSVQEPARYQNT